MKNFRKIIAVLFLVILFCVFVCTNASAMNTGMITSEASEEKWQSLIEYRKIRISYDEPTAKHLCCFNVSDSGLIALGLYDYFDSHNQISVYNESFEFLYTVEYYDKGRYYVEFDGENLIIMSVRGYSAVSVSPTGEVVDVKLIDDNEENRLYEEYVLGADERTVNGRHYVAVTKYAERDYVQLYVTDSDGNKTILFDRTVNARWMFWVIIACVVLFLAAFPFYLIYCIKKNIQKEKTDSLINGNNTQA